jgi:hypothetical protein
MYSIEEVSHFGIDDAGFAALTDTQKQSLVEARNHLISMLQAVQHGSDATKYASPEMMAKHKTSTDLAASLLEPETSILAVGVSNFTFVDERTIKLNFFAVVSSEGNILASEKVAVLRRGDSVWRVASFE